jgi:hypothetical protein
MVARLPIRLSAWPNPMVVVVLPSPMGVGVMAVTRMSLPSGRSSSVRSTARGTLAMYRPYSTMSCSPRPSECPWLGSSAAGAAALFCTGSAPPTAATQTRAIASQCRASGKLVRPAPQLATPRARRGQQLRATEQCGATRSSAVGVKPRAASRNKSVSFWSSLVEKRGTQRSRLAVTQHASLQLFCVTVLPSGWNRGVVRCTARAAFVRGASAKRGVYCNWTAVSFRVGRAIGISCMRGTTGVARGIRQTGECDGG